MSYILDALKKSDQQRQRGATPTLQMSQVTVAEPRRSVPIYYGLLALVLLVIGVTIGWLRPWQSEQRADGPTLLSAPQGKEALDAEQTNPIAQSPAPLLLAPEMPSSETQNIAVPVPEKAASLVGVARAPEVRSMNELPITIQQEIPAMTVQLHAYSDEPDERLVSINSIRLREGSSLMSGLRLEQITPDGMIFSYKGYRFQHGSR